MRKINFVGLILMVFLFGCWTNNTDLSTNYELCDYEFSEIYNEEIAIEALDIPYSEHKGPIEYFISPCKDFDITLTLGKAMIKSHQLIFSFSAIYPIEFVNILTNDLEEVNVDVSIDGQRFARVLTESSLVDNKLSLDNVLAKKVRISFLAEKDEYEIKDIYFLLGEGMIIKEETELSSAFLRFNGWSGADGIFSFDLSNGGDKINQAHSTTGFVFSDTIIGEVYPNNYVRKTSAIINNSFGYLDNQQPLSYDAFNFDYQLVGGLAQSVLFPDEYIGKRGRNLLDNEGLSVSFSKDASLTNIDEGIMFLSDKVQTELVIDFKKSYDIGSMYLWNYNQNIDYGAKEIELLYSIDSYSYYSIDDFILNRANGGLEEKYTFNYLFSDVFARYIKIKINSSYDDEYVGLGKLMFFDKEGNYLFGSVESQDEIIDLTDNEKSSRLWLQDGFVHDEKIYLFPLLVKDYQDFFRVYNVGLIQMDIVDERFDYSNAIYHSTPLMAYPKTGGVVYFGAGVMDNTDIDGYIYVYGYLDDGERNLVVARFNPWDVLNFNEWEFLNNQGWLKNMTNLRKLKTGVSAELSVTYIERGTFAGKYMLVSMENTTSGNIVYSLSSSPIGEFSDFKRIYTTTESSYLRGAFTYNAKLHPNLSTDEKLIISYNVNTTILTALVDARIYYPRFISITFVGKGDENE